MRKFAAAVVIVAVVASVAARRDVRAVGTVQPVNVTDHTALVPLGGLRATGVTVNGPVLAGDTVISVTNGLKFFVDQTIEVNPGATGELMRVVSAMGDGDPSNDSTGGIAEQLTVQRAQYGTTATTHNVGEMIYAEFSRFDIRADSLGPKDTGEMLAASLDTAQFDASAAITTSSLNSSTTTAYVSDSSLFHSGDTVQIDAEKMYVGSALPGYVSDTGVPNDSGAYLTSSTTSGATVINISDKTPLTVGWRVQVDSEQMLLNATAGDGPGGAQDTMTVTRGYNGTTAATHSAFKPVLTGLVEVSANVPDLSTTAVNISDDRPLAVGNTALIDNELMLITALSGDGFGGVQDTMTVVRQYRNTLAATHLAGVPVRSGRDRLLVTRGYGGTIAASHAIRTDVQSTGRIMQVSSQVGLSKGSTLLVDAERMVAFDVPAVTVHASGSTLTSSIGAVDSLVPITSVMGITVGETIRVDSERMAVTAATPACAPSGGLITQQALTSADTTVSVNDFTLVNFNTSCSIKIDNEEMLVTDVNGDGAGGVQDTLSVTRGWHDTAAASHSSGAGLTAGRAAVRAFRGLHATTSASHSGGAAVMVTSGETNKVRVTRGAVDPASGNPTAVVAHSAGAVIYDVDGLAAYLFQTGLSAPASGATITDPMNSSITAVGVSDATKLQAGWSVIVDSEELKLLTVVGDGPGGTVVDYITVQRGYAGSSAGGHLVGATIRGPVLAEFVTAANGPLLTSTGRTLNGLACGVASVVHGLESMTYSCATDGVSPLGPGPVSNSSGVLSTIDIVPRILLPSTPSKLMTLAGNLVDVTGDALSAGFTSGSVRVVRCPDVNADRVANFPGDVINVAKYALGLPVSPPPVFAKYDITNDGVVNFPGDAITAAKVVTLGQPSALRCVP